MPRGWATLAIAAILALPGLAAPASAQAPRWRQKPPTFAAPLPEPRPPEAQAPEPPAAAPQPQQQSTPAPPSGPSEAAAPAPSGCLARLAALGTVVEPAQPPSTAEACLIVEPVRLSALRDAAGELRFPERPLIACAQAERLALFARDVAAPLARGLLNRPLVAIGTGPGYECRPRNRVAGAKMSAHGRGLAVDIGWLELEGHRRLVIGSAMGEGEARLVAALRKAACGWFTTVLGPGSDAAHHDHLHLDAEPRGRTGDSRLCQ